MAQYQITADSEIFHHLFLKDSKDDGVAKVSGRFICVRFR
jgi:hypothetical protein